MNLFGKLFKYTILLLILAELLSLVSYVLAPLDQVAFFVVLIAVLILSIIKLEYGLYVLLAELFVGGHGHLFSFNFGGFSLSIRMGLFLVVLAVWLVNRIRNYELGIRAGKESIIHNSYFLIPYVVLTLAILIGIINGLLHNELKNVFFDFNAWLYFILILVFWHLIKNEKIIENVLPVLTGATTYLALKTISVLFLFSHNITGIGGFFYRWLRDTGVGEITYIQGTLFRIFFQSQLYCLIGFLIVLTILIYNLKLKNWRDYLSPAIYLYLTSLAIIISQSRSFWVGGLAALFVLMIFTWWQLGFRFKKTAILIIILAAIFINQMFLVQVLTNNFSGNLVADRFKNLQSEAAGISRLNQLRPLTDAILQQAVLGYGFGKTLTYQSNDPRILKNHPGGIYTTYAFEWGYLDITLKVGVLGLLIYLALVGIIFYQGIKNFKFQIPNFKQISNSKFQISNTKSLENKLPATSYKLQAGLLLGLVALCVTNIFSPYLNHPLGIGYIMLVSAVLSNNK